MLFYIAGPKPGIKEESNFYFLIYHFKIIQNYFKVIDLINFLFIFYCFKLIDLRYFLFIFYLTT
jgi:hypothetical protein